MLQQPKLSTATILLLLVVAIATVASVPTSVLVQNSEMASNSHNNNFANLKVKRSSNNIKESASSVAAALNKKSSPETVPASFNAPPPEPVSSSSSSSAQSSSAGSLNLAAAGLLPTNGDIINSAIAAGLTAAAVEAAAAASQRELEQQQQQQQYVDEYGLREDETPTLLRKRGINSQQYMYGSGGAPGLGGGYGYNYGNTDFYNVPMLGPSTSSGSSPSSQSASALGVGMSSVPNGVWSDEIDPPVVYTDLQEFDDYAPRAPYHNKAYDNLQNILNSETYLEPVALPLQYTGRYYGADADRKKRSNLNKYNKFADMRLKRDTKLTPADMLALVALVEAGERARNNADVDNADATNSYIAYPDVYDYNNNNNNNNAGRNGYYTGANAYDYQPNVNSNSNSNNNNNLDDVIGEYNGAWLEPAVVDYYGVPYNMEALPKYELQPLAPREHKYSGQNRYAAKRFMVSKKKRSLGQYLNEPLAKSSYSSYSGRNGEKYF